MNPNKQRLKYILVDCFTVLLTWLLFNVFRYYESDIVSTYNELQSFLLNDRVVKVHIIVSSFWIFLFYLSGYYNKPFQKSRIGDFFTTLFSVLIGTVIIFFLVILNELLPSFVIYYELFIALFVLQFSTTFIGRLLITNSHIRDIRLRKVPHRVLIIGAGEKGKQIARDLYKLGYDIIGFISEPTTRLAVEPTCVLGSLCDIEKIVVSENINEIVLALDSVQTEELTSVLYSLYKYNLPIKILAGDNFPLARKNVKTIIGIPLIELTDNNFKPIEENLKFVLDKLLSFCCLVLLSPLFLYIAFRVKKDSSGPVFFAQERIGYLGKPFMMYKFRSMYVQDKDSTPMLTMDNDDRVTSFGRFLRKYRLDELPQFWNVLIGDMSLVGPRPEQKYYIDQIVRKAPYYYLLHNVRPGITSLGMVKYGYADTVDKMIERLNFDMLYYENMSLAMDFTILVYTVRTVLTGKGI